MVRFEAAKTRPRPIKASLSFKDPSSTLINHHFQSLSFFSFSSSFIFAYSIPKLVPEIMLLLSVTALVLSVSSTLIDAAGINCYSGTVCSVRGVESSSLALSTKNSETGVCASMVYDCRSTNAIHVNELCKTCPGGFLTQLSTPQSAQEMANLKVQAKSFSPPAQLDSW